MSSRFRSAGLLALLVAPVFGAPRVLRVCADPNNLPFSNERGEGFENRLAELLARDLGAKVEYTWWAERKSFLKNSLGAGKCDAVMGVPSAMDSVSVTRPYYRSTYVFVSRKDRKLGIRSLADPRLEKWRIGIHAVGEDFAPPAYALGRRGLAANVVPYSLFGEYGQPNPPARLVDAVARGDVDVAIVWGPFAGFFAKAEQPPLEISPVQPATYLTVPFTYDISVAVRKGDESLRAELDAALERERPAIRALLAEFGIPTAAAQGGDEACARLP